MEYLISGLLVFAIVNLIHLEREVTRIKTEIGHIKKSLRGEKDG